MNGLPASGADALLLAFDRYRQGDLPGALARLEANPADWQQRADGWLLYGVLLRHLNRPVDAEAAYRQALAILPDYADAHYNLGNLYQACGRHDAAVAAYRQALEARSGSADRTAVRIALSAAAYTADRPETALAAARQAADENPASGAAQNQLGKLLWELGDAEGARQAFEQATGADDEPLYAINRLLVSQFSPDMTEATLAALARQAAARIEAAVSAALLPWSPAPRPTGRRVRVAYLSSDFRQSAPGAFIQSILAGHDRSIFEVWALANSPVRDDRTTAMQAAVDRWIEVHGLDDASLTRMLRQEDIDILVDLNGYTGGHRLGVLAARAAPVQITWLGYEGPLQLAGVDAIIADANVAPPANEACYSERVMRLPFSFCCYAPHPAAPQPAPPPAQARGHVTFGSFNKLAKISEPAMDLWAQVLTAVPASRLLLKWRHATSALAAERILAGFARRGIPEERIELRDASPYLDMLKEYGDMDIALDPLPFSGGATTCDALWMGVPVITLRGRRFASNHTVSHLQSAGLPELVADNEADYVAACRRLAADLPALAHLRAGLRQQMALSPLCSPRLFMAPVERHFLALLAGH